jgi:hypothetical protein
VRTQKRNLRSERSMMMSMMTSTTITLFLLVSCCAVGATRKRYEVWASDQSNSMAGQTSLGVLGSFIWIYDSDDIQTQLKSGPDATPLSCTPNDPIGPCDIRKVFPPTLQDSSGIPLSSNSTFGRLHGVLADPQHLYAVANMFTPSVSRCACCSMAWSHTFHRLL